MSRHSHDWLAWHPPVRVPEPHRPPNQPSNLHVSSRPRPKERKRASPEPGSKGSAKAHKRQLTPQVKLERRLVKGRKGGRLDLSTYASPTDADYRLTALPPEALNLHGEKEHASLGYNPHMTILFCPGFATLAAVKASRGGRRFLCDQSNTTCSIVRPHEQAAWRCG
jgi:hypothetical protein